MRIYVIEETHRNIKKKDGGMIIGNRFHTVHKWDMPNLNIYSEEGELLKEESIGVYDLEFARKVKKEQQRFEIEEFLEYQFKGTESKREFLKHLNSNILHTGLLKDKESKRFILDEWIKEKEKQLEQIPTNKDFEREKQSFAKTYGSFETPQERKSFLNGHILKTKKCIDQFLIEPHLIGEGFEVNRKYFSEANLFLNYLEEIERKDFPTEEGKESKQENFEPLEFDNLSQKLLLLETLGVLKAISETTGADISSRKMGRIISDLLGTNDLTRHLRYFNPHSQPKDKNNPRTETNLSALHANLVKLKLPKLETVVEKELSKLYSEKD